MEAPDSKYKHKPSEKHTLEEVLKSLQDLIRVDLPEDKPTVDKVKKPPSATPPTHTSAGAEPVQEKPSGQREDFAPASPDTGPVNLDAVMRSLRDLITHELNVSNESPPPNAKPAAAHDEYLEAEGSIEEYIPDELSSLDEELEINDESIRDEVEAAPPPEEILAPETIENITAPETWTPPAEELTLEAPVEPQAPPAPPAESAEPSMEISPEPEERSEESAAEAFTPLDEELTFETPIALDRPSAGNAETTELPGEISPELLEEPVSSGPAGETPSQEPEPDLAPGTQHEMSFEDSRAIASKPRSIPMGFVPVPSPQPESTPESPPPKDRAPPSEIKKEEAMESLPTIDVEETPDDREYFSAATPEKEAPPASEETIDLSVEIAPEPPTETPLVAEKTVATTPEEPPATSTVAAGGKTTLEVVDGPIQGKTHDKYSVDFDASDLTPPLPEESELSTPEESPAAENVAPAETTEADHSPAPDLELEPETPEPAKEAPPVEAKAETPPTTEASHETGESPAPETPPASDMDDIPVLKDVVDPRMAETSVIEPTAPALPAPDRARESVVRAVAKLNVEMRKSGGAGLDTRTILRLQQLIRQELEKGGKK